MKNTLTGLLPIGAFLGLSWVVGGFLPPLYGNPTPLDRLVLGMLTSVLGVVVLAIAHFFGSVIRGDE